MRFAQQQRESYMQEIGILLSTLFTAELNIRMNCSYICRNIIMISQLTTFVVDV